jgi:IMP cyclohydrolase (EC 3.5.4.10)/phosphoribosylaminoimidazolecarboxamide formyltransferase (EC 2.1.2.3)
MMKTIAGGWLAQSRDNGRITRAELKVVTERAPTEEELPTRLFAWTVAKHVKSNAIVYAKGGSTCGHRRRPDEPPRQRAHRRR